MKAPISGRLLFPKGVEWEERAQPERRPRPDAWDDFWYGGQAQQSAAGFEVNQDNALTYFAVWACRKLISEDIGSLPLHVYRRSGKDSETRERARDLGIYYLLHDAPNDEMTAMQFRETLQDHLLAYGNAYAEIQRNLRGEVIGLWPLNPDPSRMKAKRDDNGRLYYDYRLEDGTPKLFDKSDIFHLAGLGFNGLIGHSPLKYHSDIIGTGMAEQEFQGSTFRNGGRLSLALVHPAPKAPDAEGRRHFRDEIRRDLGGSANAGKIAVFWEGMKPEPMSMTLEDAQFIESRKLTWLQVCAIYRVPPHKVQYLFQATFSNIEHQSIDYVVDTVRPWVVRWEQAINSQLLNGSNRYFAEHSLEGLMRGDLKSRYDAYAIGRNWGWLSINDIRKLENMNPIENGDDYLQPMNMAPVGAEPPAPAAADQPPTDAEIQQAAAALRQLRLIRR